MSSKFIPNELCLLADLLCDDVYDAIMYSCPIYYKNAATLLNNPSDIKTLHFAQKWEVDKIKLASKLSSMNVYDSQRLTHALINYWKPYYNHDIELNLEEWAENELWNW
jgi:hypothetical protein